MSATATQAALDLVNRPALTRVLTDWIGPFERMDVELLAGGASNLTYRVVLDEVPYVMRRRPLGSSAPRAHDMAREYRVLKALGGRSLPVPAVHGFHEGDDIVGAAFYVMDFTDGIVIHDARAAGALDSEQARAASLSLVETLNALHDIGEDDLGLEKFGRPDGFLRRRIDGWLTQWGAVEHRNFPEVERLGAVLLANVPPQRYASLVHGDYRLGNVIIDREGGSRVAAVLDWEMSTLGDPLTDIAHLVVYWEPTKGRITHPAQLISSAPGFLSASELVEAYERTGTRTVADLSFYLAFEHWRAAIIKDAIYLRRRSGAMEADEGTETFGATVKAHLEESADLLRGEGIII